MVKNLLYFTAEKKTYKAERWQGLVKNQQQTMGCFYLLGSIHMKSFKLKAMFV